MTDLWQAALTDLKNKVSPHNFETWFQHIQLHHQEGAIAHLEVADEFVKVWVEDNYRDLIEESLLVATGMRMQAVIHVRGELPAPVWSEPEVRRLDLPAAAPRAGRLATSAPTPLPQGGAHFPGALPQAPARPQDVARLGLPMAQANRTTARQTDFFEALAPREQIEIHSEAQFQQIVQAAGLNPRYTFEEFVVGPSNQFTHAACQAIAHNPGQTYNPLFIFGGVGLGKTHLLQAVGIQILRHNPSARVMNLSSEEFMNQLITSLRQKDMNSFRAQFRDRCDVLLIDDIQFIGGKDSTQEEFFHTFNALYHSGKQIVMTSDKSPKELPGLEERLQSRFSWGLIADVQPPEMETRVAILERKAEVDGLPLDKDVALLLASSIRSNVRELEGVLVRLGAQASFMNKTVSLEMAREHLKRMHLDHGHKLSVERIIRVTADHFGISAADICGARRTRHISEPRQLAMFLARKHTDHSFPELGRMFGGKDHTTVMAACRKLEALDKSGDVTLRAQIDSIEARLR